MSKFRECKWFIQKPEPLTHNSMPHRFWTIREWGHCPLHLHVYQPSCTTPVDTPPLFTLSDWLTSTHLSGPSVNISPSNNPSRIYKNFGFLSVSFHNPLNVLPYIPLCIEAAWWVVCLSHLNVSSKRAETVFGSLIILSTTKTSTVLIRHQTNLFWCTTSCGVHNEVLINNFWPSTILDLYK